MAHIDRSSAENAALRQELQGALVGTALRFSDAVRRFDERRRRCGFDYSCSRLLDEISLSRSMLLVLADEVSRQRGSARAAR
jgi:hypothetical protein